MRRGSSRRTSTSPIRHAGRSAPREPRPPATISRAPTINATLSGSSRRRRRSSLRRVALEHDRRPRCPAVRIASVTKICAAPARSARRRRTATPRLRARHATALDRRASGSTTSAQRPCTAWPVGIECRLRPIRNPTPAAEEKRRQAGEPDRRQRSARSAAASRGANEAENGPTTCQKQAKAAEPVHGGDASGVEQRAGALRRRGYLEQHPTS